MKLLSFDNQQQVGPSTPSSTRTCIQKLRHQTSASQQNKQISKCFGIKTKQKSKCFGTKTKQKIKFNRCVLLRPTLATLLLLFGTSFGIHGKLNRHVLGTAARLEKRQVSAPAITQVLTSYSATTSWNQQTQTLYYTISFRELPLWCSYPFLPCGVYLFSE